jgi:hypothetical protein
MIFERLVVTGLAWLARSAVSVAGGRQGSRRRVASKAAGTGAPAAPEVLVRRRGRPSPVRTRTATAAVSLDDLTDEFAETAPVVAPDQDLLAQIPDGTPGPVVR